VKNLTAFQIRWLRNYGPFRAGNAHNTENEWVFNRLGEKIALCPKESTARTIAAILNNERGLQS